MWWACKCGCWMWEDKVRCTRCNAQAPKWIRRPRSAGARGPAASANATSASGAMPTTVTVGDFVCIPKGRKERRAATRVAKELEAARAELKDFKAAIEPGAGGTASESSTSAGCLDTDEDMGVNSPASTPEAALLASISDESLAGIAKAIPDGAPGRDTYLLEQERRRAAKLSEKPQHVQVRHVNDKWKRAEEKVSRAEKALKTAEAAVVEEKKAAASRLAALEEKAAEAGAAMALAKQEAVQAKEQLARAVSTMPANVPAAPTVEFEPGAVAYEGLLALGSFLAHPDTKAAHAAAGLTPDAASKIEVTLQKVKELFEKAAATPQLPMEDSLQEHGDKNEAEEVRGTDTEPADSNPIYRSPGTEEAHNRICEAAARARSEKPGPAPGVRGHSRQRSPRRNTEDTGSQG